MSIFKWTTEPKKIYIWVEKWEWQPWPNTVAYYPLRANFNDASWNSRNLTNSWWTITTVGWISCAYYNWSSYSRYSWYALTRTARTICVWVRLTNPKWVLHISKYNVWGPTWSLWLNTQSNKFKMSDWTSIDQLWTTTINSSTWYNVVLTQQWNNAWLYVNWSLEKSVTNYPAEQTTPDSRSIFCKDYTSLSEKSTWYINEVILENQVRTSDMVTQYYNSTKDNY